ncbi:type II secretion system F family protein [Geomobilimonas luticola]|uniref:Type II secretion system F family protein n=1 Tax=Geomobilimonas luticola TaxID=1114878 RepID=A0ABS5SI11_9BACT|nr:type II secretion system F family protein [Geomobilimonas luticola]MBT0654437.1 type II secretion system F family protein [Geomobilimonas luticola]
MAIYTCKLGSVDGKIIVKELEATNREYLRQSLEDQGFFVFELKKKSFQFLWDKGIARKKVDNRELLSFNQELLVLIKSGMPIIQALDVVLERGGKGKLQEILHEVREDIKGGASLSDAFEKHPRAFSHLYIASIRAGERTGDLPLTIRRYVAFLKRMEGFRKKVVSALIYPSILLTLATVVVTVLLVYVVPIFSQIFADVGSQLPLPTRLLIAFTVVLKTYLPLIVAAAVIAGYFARRWMRTTAGRYTVDRVLLRIPFLGPLMAQYAVAGFTRTLGTILGSGIPIVESLKMAVGTLNNKVLERKLLQAVVRVEEGTTLVTALEGVKLMPPLALRMLGVGETTGALEEMLADISEYFEEEIDRQLHVLTTAIEPAILIVTGLIIGVIIITLYLPVFKIGAAVG